MPGLRSVTVHVYGAIAITVPKIPSRLRLSWSILSLLVTVATIVTPVPSTVCVILTSAGGSPTNTVSVTEVAVSLSVSVNIA